MVKVFMNSIDKDFINQYLDKEFDIKKYKIADKKYIESLFVKIKNKEPLDLSYTYFDGFPLDEYRKNNNISETEIIELNFDNAVGAIFDLRNKYADFSWVEFIGVDLDAGISFKDATFVGGKVDFSYCKFNNVDLAFENAKFINTKLLLVYCENIKDLMFTEVTKNNADFIIFGIETLNGDIDFSKLNCLGKEFDKISSGKILIEKCTFRSSVLKFNNNDLIDKNDYLYFLDNKFDMKNVEFYNSSFNGVVFFDCTFDNKVIFTDCVFNYFILQNCILRDAFKITYEEVSNEYDTKFCFLGTIFNGYFDMENKISSKFLNRQKKFVIDYNESVDNIDDRFYLDDTSFLEKSIQTNNLSEIFSALGKSSEQDKTYALFKRYKNLYRIQEQWYCLKSIKSANEFSIFQKGKMYIKYMLLMAFYSIIFFIEFVLLDLICGNYATNPFKFFAWIITIIVGFAIFINCAFDINELELVVNLPERISNCSTSILISVANFFQIDLFDAVKSFGLYITSLIEKILGIILLAIFTVSYTRKVIK